MFENDVEMYGAQTALLDFYNKFLFENDVEMYGAQTKDRLEQRADGFGVRI